MVWFRLQPACKWTNTQQMKKVKWSQASNGNLDSNVAKLKTMMTFY